MIFERFFFDCSTFFPIFKFLCFTIVFCHFPQTSFSSDYHLENGPCKIVINHPEHGAVMSEGTFPIIVLVQACPVSAQPFIRVDDSTQLSLSLISANRTSGSREYSTQTSLAAGVHVLAAFAFDVPYADMLAEASCMIALHLRGPASLGAAWPPGGGGFVGVDWATFAYRAPPADDALRDPAVTGVLHIGGHYAEEAAPYAVVVGSAAAFVEALPACAGLCRSVARIYGMDCFQALLLDRDGEEMDMHVASNTGFSSSVLPLHRHADIYPEVSMTGRVRLTSETFASLSAREPALADPRLNFLVVDAQGSEYEVLQGFGPALRRFLWIRVEVSEIEMYRGQRLRPAVDDLLLAQGFRPFSPPPAAADHGERLYRRGGPAPPPAMEAAPAVALRVFSPADGGTVRVLRAGAGGCGHAVAEAVRVRGAAWGLGPGLRWAGRLRVAVGALPTMEIGLDQAGMSWNPMETQVEFELLLDLPDGQHHLDVSILSRPQLPAGGGVGQDGREAGGAGTEVAAAEASFTVATAPCLPTANRSSSRCFGRGTCLLGDVCVPPVPRSGLGRILYWTGGGGPGAGGEEEGRRPRHAELYLRSGDYNQDPLGPRFVVDSAPFDGGLHAAARVEPRVTLLTWPYWTHNTQNAGHALCDEVFPAFHALVELGVLARDVQVVFVDHCTEPDGDCPFERLWGLLTDVPHQYSASYLRGGPVCFHRLVAGFDSLGAYVWGGLSDSEAGQRRRVDLSLPTTRAHDWRGLGFGGPAGRDSQTLHHGRGHVWRLFGEWARAAARRRRPPRNLLHPPHADASPPAGSGGGGGGGLWSRGGWRWVEPDGSEGCEGDGGRGAEGDGELPASLIVLLQKRRPETLFTPSGPARVADPRYGPVQVLNLDAVEEELRRAEFHGLQTTQAEWTQLTMWEQLWLLERTKVLVSPPGANLVNAVLLPAGAHVVVLCARMRLRHGCGDDASVLLDKLGHIFLYPVELFEHEMEYHDAILDNRALLPNLDEDTRRRVISGHMREEAEDSAFFHANFWYVKTAGVRPDPRRVAAAVSTTLLDDGL